MKRKLIIKKYIFTRFIFDFIATIPFNLILDHFFQFKDDVTFINLFLGPTLYLKLDLLKIFVFESIKNSESPSNYFNCFLRNIL